jgi:hypothetical protein
MYLDNRVLSVFSLSLSVSQLGSAVCAEVRYVFQWTSTENGGIDETIAVIKVS